MVSVVSKKRDTLFEVRSDIAARGGLLDEISSPGRVGVGPGLDGKDVAGIFVERKRAAPTVVVERRHRSLGEFRLVLTPPLDDSADDRVTVPENVGFDDTRFARDALDGITATSNRGCDRFDDVPIHRMR